MLQDRMSIGIVAMVFFALIAPAAPFVSGISLAGLSIYYLISGFDALTKNTAPQRSSPMGNRRGEKSVRQTTSAPVTDEPTIAERIRLVHLERNFKCPNCGATIKNATDRICQHCNSVLVEMSSLPLPEFWPDVEIGQSVGVRHPKQDQINTEVIYRLFYGELWQVKMRKDVPWTLTGNYYAGLGLDNGMYLLNWKSRFYLLDSQSPLSDLDINRDFATHAREFAASNQTKAVKFSHQTETWTMTDIGRFRIEYSEGGRAKARAGAIGRFIHAQAGDQILIVEDFQSGGNGRDTLWKGYEITEKKIKF